MNQNTILSNDRLQAVAPSIFATEPWERMSSRYAFVPTIQVIQGMEANGFFPVDAGQSKTRIAGKSDFTKHMVRFRHSDHLQNFKSEVPEIVLVNSHDGTSSYQLHVGLFRFVCMNGMIVKASDFGTIFIRHSGNIVDDVIEGSYSIIEEAPKLLERVDGMKSHSLSAYEQLLLAKGASQLRWEDDKSGNSTAPFNAHHLLDPRRSYEQADRAPTLWNTFNNIQENLVKGGIRGHSSTGRRTRTRSIKSVTEDIKLNRQLWALAEGMRAAKEGREVIAA